MFQVTTRRPPGWMRAAVVDTKRSMQPGSPSGSASAESAPVSNRDEHGFNLPEIQYGSESDREEHPSPSQYDFESVAKEAAYELLERDEEPQSKPRQSRKIRNRESYSEGELRDADDPPSMVNSDDDEEEDQEEPSESISSFGAEELAKKLQDMSIQLDFLIRQSEKEKSKKRARNDSYAPDPKARKQSHAFDAPRRFATQVLATPSDSERTYEQDEDTESSVRTPRRKVQPPWVFVGLKHTATDSPAAIRKWLTDFADAQMLLAGPYSQGRNLPEDLGAFKQGHVSLSIIVLVPMYNR